MSGVGDPLSEINGIKPIQLLSDGQEITQRSQNNGKRSYTIRRTGNTYTCSCPVFRIAKKPLNRCTCVHLKDTFGEEYEKARVETGSQDESKPKSKEKKQAKPVIKGSSKPKSTDKRKREADDEGDRAEPESGGSDGVVPAEEEGPRAAAQSDGDPLAQINGISPLVVIADGEEKEISSQTSSSKYRVKRTGDHYYCTCPAWRMQSGSPVNARSCKHLKSLLGEGYENARVEMMNPGGSSGSKGNTKGKAPASSNKKVKTTKAPELLLANKWDLESGADPTSWWASEKLDGVRAYFDGASFQSRLGNPFSVPQNLIDLLPKDVKLDGELFGGRGKFNDTVSIVRSSQSPKWAQGVVTYQIFDIISLDKDTIFEDRIAKLNELFGPNGTHKSDFAVVVEQTMTESRDHLLDMLKEVENLGGEGVMIRKPNSQYEGRRSSTLLKIKTFYDAEAIVTGYEPGKGRHKGVTGALKCEMESGKTFRVGTGLSDAQRRKPPKVGAIIVYRFQELTPDGVPRFPSYVGEAIDKTEPKDADVPSTRKASAKDKDDA